MICSWAISWWACSYIDETRYMLVLNKKILYFQSFKDVVTYLKLVSLETADFPSFEIYVRDKKSYVFVTDNIDL